MTHDDTVLQPPGICLGIEVEPSIAAIDPACNVQGVTVHRVMQPIWVIPGCRILQVLARIHQLQLVPGLRKEDFLRAMDDLPAGVMLAANAPLFQATG